MSFKIQGTTSLTTCLVIRSDMHSRSATHITSGPRRIDTSLVCSIMRGVFLSYGLKTLYCTRPASKSSTMSFFSCHTLFAHAWQDLISCSSLRLYPHSDWYSLVSTIKKETRVRQPVRNQPLTPQLSPTMSCGISNISSCTLLNTWMIPLLRETSPSPTVSSSSAAVVLKRALNLSHHMGMFTSSPCQDNLSSPVFPPSTQHPSPLLQPVPRWTTRRDLCLEQPHSASGCLLRDLPPSLLLPSYSSLRRVGLHPFDKPCSATM